MKAKYNQSKSFSKQEIAKLLSEYFGENERFVERANEILNIIHLHQLDKKHLSQIINKINDVNYQDNNIKAILIQIVSYQYMNSQDVNLDDFLTLINQLKTTESKSEMVFCLINAIELNQFDKLQNKQFEQLEQLLINNDIKEEAILKLKLCLKSLSDIDSFIPYPKNSMFVHIYVPNLTFINQQWNSFELQNNYEIQEQKNQSIIDIQLYFETEVQKQVLDQQIDILPQPISIKSGRSIFNGTYSDICTLYKATMINEPLTNWDKDEYLPGKLLGKKYFCGGIFGELICDRMIIQIFLNLSLRTKENRQTINQTALEKIIILCNDKDSVFQRLFQGKCIQEIQRVAEYSWIPNDNLNEIEREFQEIERNNPIEFINQQVQKIRYEAMNIIYNLHQIQRVPLNNDKFLKQVRKNIQDSNENFRILSRKYYFLKIGNNLDQESCTILFAERVGPEEQDIILFQLKQYCMNQNACQKLIKFGLINYLFFILNISKWKQQILEILLIILRYNFQHPLNENQIYQLAYHVIYSKDNKIKKIIYNIIFIISLKLRKLTLEVIDTLFHQFKRIKQKQQCFVILIISNLELNQPLEKLQIKSVVEFGLKNDDKIIQENNVILFKTPTIELRSRPSISQMASKIIISHIKIGGQFSLQSQSKLLDTIGSTIDEQTQILLAKALCLVKDLKFNQNIQLNFLFQFTKHQIYDIQIYSTYIYTKQLVSLSEEEVIDEFNLRNLSFCYQYDESFKIDDIKYNESINQYIFKTIQNILIKQNQEFSESLINLFKTIFLNSNILEKPLNFLQELANSNIQIPILVQEAVCMKFQDYKEQNFQLGHKIAINKHPLCQSFLKICVDYLLYQEQNEQQYKILEMATENQYIPDNIYKYILVERAAISIMNKFQDKDYAIEYLSQKIENNVKLTKNTFKAFQGVLGDEKVLDIIIRLLQINIQSFPIFLFDQLVEKLESDECQEKILSICIQQTNNMGVIPQKLIYMLENAFQNQKIQQKFKWSYIICSNNRGLIEYEIKNKSNYIAKALNKQLEKECPDKNIIHLISFWLQRSIENSNFDDQIIDVIRNLFNKHDNDQKDLKSVLFQQFFNKNCKDDVLIKIYKILSDLVGQDEYQKNLLEQFKVSQRKIENCELLIKDIIKINQGKLIIPLFNQLNQVLKTRPQQFDDVINILSNCQNKNDIPQDLNEQIEKLREQQNDHQDQQQIINNNRQNKVVIQEQLKILHKKFQLQEDIIKDLVELNDKYLQILNKSDYSQFSIETNKLIFEYCERQINQEIAQIIEKKILLDDSKNLEINILNAYSIIILNGYTSQLEQILEKLSNHLQNDQASLTILIAYLTNKDIKKNMLMLDKILFYLSDTNNKYFILSFRFFQQFSKNHENKKNYQQQIMYFQSWIKTYAEKHNLKENEIDNFIGIEFINPNILNQENWKEQIYLYNLCFKFNFKEQKQFNDLHLLFNSLIEQRKYDSQQYQKILQMINQINQLTFQQIVEIINFLEVVDLLDLETSTYLSIDTYFSLKQKWIYKILEQNKNIKQIIIKELIKIQKLDVNLIKQLFSLIQSNYFINQDQIQELIQFLFDHNDDLAQIYKKNQIKLVNDGCILQQFQMQVLLGKFNYEENQKTQIEIILKQLIKEKNYKLETFESYFNCLTIEEEEIFQIKQKEAVFIKCLKMLSYFKQQFLEIKNIQEIFEKTPVIQWQFELNKLFFDKLFPDKQETQQNLTQLIQQLNSMNNLEYLNSQQFNKIQSIENFNDDRYLDPFIDKWDQNYIQKWIKDQDRNFLNQKDQIILLLAVIYRAVKLTLNIEINKAQLLAVLAAYQTGTSGKGRLLQINTGEGKSLIICILAIIYAFDGKTIDIITSSPVLAKRDATEMEKLYKIFHLTCSHNSDIQPYLKGEKQCYRKHIVYGDATQFQFDYLRHHYLNLNTLGERGQQFVIIDEVDFMLIDNGNRQVRLSSSIAGFDTLKPIYFLIWYKLLELQDRNGLYMGGNIQQQFLDFKNEQIGQNNNDIIQIQQLMNQTAEIKDKVRQQLLNYLKVEFRKQYEFASIFNEFIEQQTPKWVESAMLAYEFKENIQYIVYKGMILPVDYQKTGIILEQSIWQDGLHQFLQIKHNLKVTSESLTTNFLSNICYIKKYKNNLIGLTGTVGSLSTQDLLNKVYNLLIIKVPSQRKRQYIEFPTKIKDNNYQWIEEVCNSAIDEAQKQRGILIICETIEFSELIYKALKSIQNRQEIKIYHMNNLIQVIQKGEIIVAKNLAGRGTDINTNNIQEFGGLHVILTFLPCNQRVEEQAFGRASRQGYRGSGQMILNKSALIIISDDISKIKNKRNEIEVENNAKFQEIELRAIQIKDDIFQKFCQKLNEIRRNLQSETQALKENSLLYIEQLWAMFLRKIEIGIISLDNSNIEFDKFIDDILKRLKKNDFIQNPYHQVIIGNSYFRNLNLEEAKNHYDTAIKFESKYCPAAYQRHGLVFVQKEKQFKISQDQKQEINMEVAIKDFQKSILCLEREIKQLQDILSLSNSDAYEQIQGQLYLLFKFVQSLNDNIECIKKSCKIRNIIIKSKRNEQNFFEQYIDLREIEIQNLQNSIFNDDNYQEFSIYFNTSEAKDYALSLVDDLVKFESQISLEIQAIDVDIKFLQDNQNNLNNCQIVVVKENLEYLSLVEFLNELNLFIFDFEIMGQNQELLNLLSRQFQNKIQIVQKELKNYKIDYVTKNDAIQRINENPNAIQSIIIRQINKQDINILITNDSQSKFNVCAKLGQQINPDASRTKFNAQIVFHDINNNKTIIRNIINSVNQCIIGVKKLNQQQTKTIINNSFKINNMINKYSNDLRYLQINHLSNNQIIELGQRGLQEIVQLGGQKQREIDELSLFNQCKNQIEQIILDKDLYQLIKKKLYVEKISLEISNGKTLNEKLINLANSLEQFEPNQQNWNLFENQNSLKISNSFSQYLIQELLKDEKYHQRFNKLIQHYVQIPTEQAQEIHKLLLEKKIIIKFTLMDNHNYIEILNPLIQYEQSDLEIQLNSLQQFNSRVANIIIDIQQKSQQTFDIMQILNLSLIKLSEAIVTRFKSQRGERQNNLYQQ